MVNARPRRRMVRLAATLGLTALLVGGLATATIHLGPTLWALTVPADRLGALVVEAERERAQRRPPDPVLADGARGLIASSSLVSPRAAAPGRAAVDDVRRAPFARVGARISVAERTPAPAQPGEPPVSDEGEPAFTVETVRGQTVYRMNGELVLDPGQHRQEEERVEAGYEYRFGTRGLEKVKLWEVRR